MDCFFEVGCLKKKENTKQDYLHNNKETDGTAILQVSETHYKRNLNI
jgi:hypothetical protein